MPSSDWLATSVHHSSPMSVFLVPSTIVSDREPTDDLFSSHFLDVHHGEHDAHAWQFKFDNLKYEGLVEFWVDHVSTNGSLAF